MTLKECAEKLNDWARGTMIGGRGTRLLSAEERRAVAQRFPLTVQLAVSLVRNTDRGTLTAEAEILHRGRTTIVVDVQVLDDQRRFVTKLVATQLALRPAPSRA